MAGKSVKNQVKTTPKTVKKVETVSKNTEIQSKPDAELTFSSELMSVSALSRLFEIDRGTIRTRIENAKIKPVKVAANEKLYELTEELEMVLRQDELEAAKLRKIEAEAELKEHDLAVKRSEFGSVAEFTEITQRIFGKLYKKVVVQLPKRVSARLHNSNSTAELMQILETELASEFNDLRSDFKKFI